MVHFSLNIKACCLYVIWEKQDQIWAKIFCIPKIMHSRTPIIATCTDWNCVSLPNSSSSLNWKFKSTCECISTISSEYVAIYATVLVYRSRVAANILKCWLDRKFVQAVNIRHHVTQIGMKGGCSEHPDNRQSSKPVKASSLDCQSGKYPVRWISNVGY